MKASLAELGCESSSSGNYLRQELAMFLKAITLPGLLKPYQGSGWFISNGFS